MPYAASGAQRASRRHPDLGTSPSHPGAGIEPAAATPTGDRAATPRLQRRHHLARPLVVALIAALLIPAAVTPPAAQAACGTNWDSKRVPPDTIRVYRTKTGEVDVVDFRRYVGIVMASGEWPTWLPDAVLEVGAVATKQFAWYYALEGHHRDWYVSPSGVCYDVRDDTNDQLFRPEKADVKRNQLDAIEATWGLTLRKRGRFFLTGYRAGADVPCAADADGWKIYATSATRCAEKGWDRQRIQEAYLKPNIEFVWNGDIAPAEDDTVDPTVTQPKISMVRDSTLGTGVARVTWSGADTGGAGLARYQLQRRIDGGEWRNVDLARARQTSVVVELSRGKAHRFRVRAVDHAGNASTYKPSVIVVPRLHQTTGASTTYANGPWMTGSPPRSSGGDTRYSTTQGAKATLDFTGRSVAVIAPRSPNRGRARIWIDGEHVATVDLSATSYRSRKLVFTKTWAQSGAHTITLVVAGTDGRPRVDVDAFLVYEDGA